MKLNTDIFFRISIAIGVVIIAARVLSPIMHQFLDRLITGNRKKRNNDNDNFNRLIEQKRQVIGGKQINHHGQNSKHCTSKENKTILAYEKEGNKQAIALFHAANWGTGAEISDIKNNLKTKYSINFEITDLSSSLRYIIKNNLLIKVNRNTLPNINEIKYLIATRTILNTLFLDIQHGNGKVLNGLAKKWPEKTCLIQSFVLYILQEMKISPHQSFMHILNPKKFASEPFMGILSKDLNRITDKMLFSSDKKQIISTDQIIKTITKNYNIFYALNPIPDPSNVDIKEIYKIFNATENTNNDILKKRYKNLASTLHPDKLAQYNIPDSIKKMANENFANLQKAYEQLKKRGNVETK